MKILKFGAVWCSGCLVMRPRWQEIENEMPSLITEYYDFDKDKDAVNKHKIDTTLPAFIFLDKNENEIIRLTGEVEKKELIRIINENIDK